MQIVTDRGMDLAPEQKAGLHLHQVPLRLMLDGNSYSSGEDIQPEEFYRLLAATESYPTTSQPSAGDFASLYEKLAETDPDILSIHISSGLSGTLNSARAAAKMVPQANVTFFDSKTLSVPLGWQVEAAARALQAGKSLEEIIAILEQVRASAEGIFTLSTLKYLIHGGRISHIRGLLASVLGIKPIIGVEKENGTYVNFSNEMTFKRAVGKIANIFTEWYQPGTALRIQLLHAYNPEGVELLRQKLDGLFEIHWEPDTVVAPVLGAHTGPSLTGCAVAPMSTFAALP